MEAPERRLRRDGSLATRLARVLAWVFHPFCVALPVGTVAAIAELGLDLGHLGGLALLTSAVTVGPALVWIVVLARLGWIGDDYLLVERRHRPYVYPAMLLGFVLDAEWVFRVVEPFPLGRAMAWAACAVAACLLAANHFTKVSLHCAGNAGILAGVALVYGAPALWLAPILPIVAWARLHTRNHTPVQVVAGSLLGALPVLLVTRLFPGV